MSLKNIKTRQQLVAEQAAEAAAEAQAQRLQERTAPSALVSALEVLADQVIAPQADALPVGDLLAAAPLFADWGPGKAYPAGKLLNYNGVVLKVVQTHTSQANWLPDELPALYTAYRPPGQASPWVQPTGAQDAYSIGEEVTHPTVEGVLSRWRSKIDANTTEPGRDGEFHRWWEPLGPV